MHESGENYLETILMIKEKKGVVRSIDVARALNFSKPSVTSLQRRALPRRNPSTRVTFS